MDLFPAFKQAQFREKCKPHTRHFLSKASPEAISLEQLLSYASEEELENWNRIHLDYSSPQGDESLRTTIAEHYDGLSTANIVCFAGAQEAIFACMHALVKPEDQLAAITPLFEPLVLTAQGIGAWINFCPMDYNYEDGWDLDLSKWLDQIDTDTQLATINFPHNPTGHLITRDEQKAIIDKARDTDTWLFSDEVFRGLEYVKENRLPPAATLYEKAVSLGVMSKAFGLSGVRVGWIATQDQELIKRLLELKLYLSICNGVPDEFLAAIALRNAEQLFQRNVDLIQSNIQLIEQNEDRAFEWIRPKAGCLAFPKLKEYENARAYSLALLKAQGALVLPGDCFLHGQAHIRLGLGQKNLTL